MILVDNSEKCTLKVRKTIIEFVNAEPEILGVSFKKCDAKRKCPYPVIHLTDDNSGESILEFRTPEHIDTLHIHYVVGNELGITFNHLTLEGARPIFSLVNIPKFRGVSLDIYLEVQRNSKYGLVVYGAYGILEKE